MNKPRTIKIDNIEYIRADQTQPPKTHEDYVIIRSDRAGVFAGHLVEHDRETNHVVLTDSRRLWQFVGGSISEVAQKGAIEPENCKYCVPLTTHTIGTVIEVVPCTEEAMESIKAVESWVR